MRLRERGRSEEGEGRRRREGARRCVSGRRYRRWRESHISLSVSERAGEEEGERTHALNPFSSSLICLCRSFSSSLFSSIIVSRKSISSSSNARNWFSARSGRGQQRADERGNGGGENALNLSCSSNFSCFWFCGKGKRSVAVLSELPTLHSSTSSPSFVIFPLRRSSFPHISLNSPPPDVSFRDVPSDLVVSRINSSDRKERYPLLL